MVELFRDLLVAGSEAGIVSGLGTAWARVLKDLSTSLPPAVPGTPPEQPARGGMTHRLQNRGRGRLGGARWVGDAWEDLGSALRSLRREPRFTGLVVGVLAVGIALNVAVFAVLNAYLLKPLPYPYGERLVSVSDWSAVSWTEVDEVFERAISWDLDVFTIVGDGKPELAKGAWVTPDFLDAYAVRAAIGRTFRPDEAGEGRTPVAMISHRLWRERFGGDPGIVGRTFRAYMSDRPDAAELFTIVGVLPSDFWYFNEYTDVLAPIRDERQVYTGRLRPDVSIGQAEEHLTQLAVSRMDEVPPDFRVRLQPLHERHVEEVRPTLLVLQAAVLLVLLIACANAAVLLLVRSTGRERELGIRRALGAAGTRLARHLMAEGMLLTGAAGVIGVGLASIGLGAVRGAVQFRLGRSVPGGLDSLSVDGWVLAATVGVCGLVGIAFGLVPLFTSARGSLSDALGAGTRGTDPAGRRRVRSAMVVAEVALSLALLTGAGLMVRSAVHLQDQDLGFDPSRIVRGVVGLRHASYPTPSDRHAIFDRLVTRVRDLPGVTSAGLVATGPFTNNFGTRTVEGGGVGSANRRTQAVSNLVGDGYFSALGIDLVRGRDFTAEDMEATEPVAVISETLARELWPGEDPLGREVRVLPMVMPGMTPPTPPPWHRVVGVVSDIQREVGGTEAGDLYRSYRQAGPFWMNVMVRTQPGAPSVVPRIEGILRDLDPEVPLSEVLQLEEAVGDARAPTRFLAGLLGGFSGFALLLAVLGLYGVIAYAARQRRRDVAIRMALGADRATVIRLFVAQGLTLSCIGVALGMAGGYVLGRALEGQLHGVSPGDPATHVTLAGVLLLTALLAVWVPARRAAEAEPMGVLREE